MIILSDLILVNPDITVIQAWEKARDLDPHLSRILFDYWLSFGPDKKLCEIVKVDV